MTALPWPPGPPGPKDGRNGQNGANGQNGRNGENGRNGHKNLDLASQVSNLNGNAISLPWRESVSDQAPPDGSAPVRRLPEEAPPRAEPARLAPPRLLAGGPRVLALMAGPPPQ